MRRCEDEKEGVREGVKMRRCEDEIQTPTIGRTLRSDALGKKVQTYTIEPMSFMVGARMIIQNCQLIWSSRAAFAAFCPILYPLGK